MNGEAGSGRGAHGILILILLLAGAVRFHGLGKNSFWHDEFLSLQSSSGQNTWLMTLPANVLLQHPPTLTRLDKSAPWQRLWRVEDGEIHPPLYFILLRFWREAFGDSEFAVRSLSALVSVGAVFFFYAAVSMQGSVTTALWSAALLAVAGPQIETAQLARDYALWMALGSAGAYALLAIENRGISIGRVIGLGICALALPLTHYMAALSVISLGIYAIARLRGRTRWIAVGTLLVASVLFLILWRHQLHNQRVEWLTDHAEHHLSATLSRIIAIPLRAFSNLGDNRLLAVIFFIAVIFGLYRGSGDRRILFWIIWLVPLLALITCADLAQHSRMLEISRYTFVAQASFCALVPIMSQRIFRRDWWIAPAGVFLLGLVSLPWSYPQPTEWRDVAALLRKAVAPGDVIVYTCGTWNIQEAYYLFQGIDHYAPDMPGATVLLTDIHSPIVRELPLPGRSVWMICFQADLLPEVIFPNGRVVQQMVLPNVGRVSQVAAR